MGFANGWSISMIFGTGQPPDVPMTPEGWFIWPDDIQERRQWFVEESIGHPAKANIHMLRSIWRQVSKPGETLLDPMSGVGSLMMAALEHRPVVLLEIQPSFHDLQLQSRDRIETKAQMEEGGTVSIITNILSDCLLVLPIPCDHIIFSPPYADILAVVARGGEYQAEKIVSRKHAQTMEAYGDQLAPGNLGRMDRFVYNQKMEQVYRRCAQSVRPGGTMTVIIKDYIRQNKRVFLSPWVAKVCAKYGFEELAWWKRKARGVAFQEHRRSMGLNTVDDEDVMVWRKR